VIFVDTGAFLARYVKRDRHHESAREAWRRLERGRDRCFTSNHVLDETFTLLGRRTSYAFAADRARSLLASRALTVVRPDGIDEREAVELFAKYADHEVSFTDALSFVIMRRSRIRRAFTFDRNFVDAGFDAWPDRG
jgi:predicted nucleic acid-binding protein